MKYLKIFISIFFFLIIVFAGCKKNDMSTINGPVNENDVPLLSKLGSSVHAVYTLSNSTGGNHVIMLTRSGNGTLTNAGSFSTGGTGTGSGLGSQGALVLNEDLIFAVNAGSNDVSVLSVGSNGLSFVDKKPSGGTMPISLTAHGNLLYVLNGASPENITGFNINNDGTISQIAGSTQPLSGAGVGPAQIEFTPDGQFLIVTEKGTNQIDTYIVGSNGIASGPIVQSSSGNTPFGFEFDKRGHLIVSDAFGGGALAGAMSSYNVNTSGVSLINGPIFNSQTAPCWVTVTKNGKLAYTTNTGTSNISGYFVGQNGSLALFNDNGNSASTGAGSSPIDMAVSDNSQYLYVLSGGTNTISVFRIDNGNGSLSSVQTVTGFTAGTIGLAAN